MKDQAMTNSSAGAGRPRGPRGRNESIRRVLRLAKRLEGLRYAPSLADLALEFQVTTRTVYRDLELLESLNFQLPHWRLNEQLADLRSIQRTA